MSRRRFEDGRHLGDELWPRDDRLAWAGDDRDALDRDDLEEADVLPPAPLFPPDARPITWKEHLAALHYALESAAGEPTAAWPEGRELLYVVDAPATTAHNGLFVEVDYRDPRKRGGWTQPRRLGLHQAAMPPEPRDRQILALLGGARDPDRLWLDEHAYGAASHRYLVPAALQETLMPLLCATGRCWLRPVGPDAELGPLGWDDGEAWTCALGVQLDAKTGFYAMRAWLGRGGERMELSAPRLLVAGGLVFTDDRVARLDDGGIFAWIAHLREHRSLRVPQPQAAAFLESLLRLPRVPRIELPEELRYEEVSLAPQPRLRIRAAPSHWGSQRLRASLGFNYGGARVAAGQEQAGVFDAAQRRFLIRDRAAEGAAAARLRQLGFGERPVRAGERWRPAFDLPARDLPRAIGQLVRDGWHVEADGRLYRQPGSFNIEVTSGVDWFELHGSVAFGSAVVPLPELLAAVRRRESTVVLGDGSFGVLPEEWLRRSSALAGLGTPALDHVRFARTQVGLLDALLSTLPASSCDAVFARAREELARFDGITPHPAPPGFVGALRGYQQEGLGWLHFLQRFGFGGCLADDMGLGKTVQVLALLEARRSERESAAGEHAGPRASLVVVPKSLVFNWKQEALRFAPKLRVLDHTGAGRLRPGEHFDDHDVVLTTYGTLRRDAPELKDLRFDYVILDEAQAIKNAATESAKAVRLLTAAHRLALSGTPVQNHLGELWSLFEFLNPGVLGAASAFGADGAGARTLAPDTLTLVARGLRPFILRRTKEQVARDLPAKTEQTVYCELDAEQRKLYDELRDHYRARLLRKVGRDGLNRSKIQVLEALLRLRQAACHPGLLDRARLGDSSAKLDVLLPRLAEVREEGHKALVFSQFTSLLAIVRGELDRAGIVHEYLDGRTRDRAARVERFQTDPDCRVFLVSLKAGGLGLNLTAAEYVFLLDPWWNPAVEAQAIDRTHRIGQTEPVFAYRLIARGTVEEKVLELQETKRALADSIIAADESLIRTLTREDLELLLS
jgi:superfamily II DNA or RNA helicase